MDAAHRFNSTLNTDPVVLVNSDPVNGISQSSLMMIDAEQPSDILAREKLLDRAMGLKRKRKSSEKLRRGYLPAEGLALVARGVDDSLLGTVRLWNVTVGLQVVQALLLGPLAVAPEMRSAGIGSALMWQAIERAKALGYAVILLMGDPEYYGRFGFSAQKTQNLSMPGPYEKHRFLALELESGVLEAATGVLQASGRLLPQKARSMKWMQASAKL